MNRDARHKAGHDEERTGAAEGIRTPDPRITNAVLYQLSYRGIPAERRCNTRQILTQGAPGYLLLPLPNGEREG
jgi:hypothetical protein